MEIYMKILIWATCTLILFLILSACESAKVPATPTLLPTSMTTDTPVPLPTRTNTPIPTATTILPTTFPDEFKGKVDLGEFKLTLLCEGKGEPTIILEDGLGGNSWGKGDVIRFGQITRTCLYRRYKFFSIQEADVALPRTTLDQVQDLNNLLQTAGVPGPYILVGHSLAGFNMPLYTDQYPKDVVGLVCVDCRPAFWYYPEPGDNWTQNNEGLDISASLMQVLKVTDLGDRPFVVLVAAGTNDETGGEWSQAAQELCNLSSQCRLEVVPAVDHTSILRRPAVDKAVREVYDAVN
jgi:hypothetical protein